MAIIQTYTLFWAFWSLWVFTIGRLNHGLSLPFTIVFNILFGIAAYFLIYKNKVDRIEKTQTHVDLYSIIKILIILLLGSTIFTVFFMLPFDWDGNDYHLPPIIEAFQNQIWQRSENPYFAARNYPKIASLPALWWLIHFGKWLGLKHILIIPMIHWLIGFFTLKKIFNQLKWLPFFWLIYPLAMKQSTTFYADLPALICVIIFGYFVIQKRYAWAALALALFSSIKFTNLASGLVFFIYLIYSIHKSDNANKKILYIYSILIVGLFSSIQPIDNYRAENKFFGPLQCKILGHDFCNGSIDPNTLIVTPVIDINKESSYFSKIAQGWIPQQLIPGADVHHGGFGVVGIVSLFLLIGLLFNSQRRNLFFSHFTKDQKLFLGFCLIADLVIPGLWYCRYHLIFGMLLVLVSSVLNDLTLFKNVIIHRIIMLIACIQLVWLIPQRVWFLGIHSVEEKMMLTDNLKHIIEFGTPKYAIHDADRRQIEFYKLDHKIITICGNEFRPILGVYGSTLSNEVRFKCDMDQDLNYALVNQTKVWIKDKNN